MFDMIWNGLIDHIPLWGWLVIFGVPSIAVLYYLSPILLPIWRMLPAPVKGILIGAGAALLAYLGGRYKGRHNAEDEAKRQNAHAQQTRDEVNREVNALPDGEARKRLRDSWTRPPS